MEIIFNDTGKYAVAFITLLAICGVAYLIWNCAEEHAIEDIYDELVRAGLAEYYIDADNEKAWRIKEKFMTQAIIDESEDKSVSP